MQKKSKLSDDHRFCFFFSNTYEAVRANSNVIWKFQRYFLIEEYSGRPYFAPPFSLLNNAYDIGKCLSTKLRKCSCKFKECCCSKLQKCDRGLRKYYKN